MKSMMEIYTLHFLHELIVAWNREQLLISLTTEGHFPLSLMVCKWSSESPANSPRVSQVSVWRPANSPCVSQVSVWRLANSPCRSQVFVWRPASSHFCFSSLWSQLDSVLVSLFFRTTYISFSLCKPFYNHLFSKTKILFLYFKKYKHSDISWGRILLIFSD